ncbi:potassium channel subfamily K member 1-like isoform X2 [Saccostrea echinata]|uniref:potassium channel subfamily K member 1-like isoform X2 n=1 Tax=Saccostrea echinata TaxID=191078 RepID=UPI002A838963|nr:potassium channel subfamily K member 1-like isoform X2 [Saccostrea echinata]
MLKLRKSTIRLLALAVFYLLYLVIGASVFSAIEGPQERELIKNVKKLRSQFLTDNTCLTDDKLEKFIASIVIATNRGVSATKNVTMSEPNWTFGQSIFFAGTLLTTIGYGRVAPLSEAGKGFCLLYAMIGIPLTLIFFTAIVERLMIPTKMFLYFLFRKLGHLYRVFHIQLLHFFILLLAAIVFIFIIPASIYSALEPKWDFLDSFYYCFISMTTIGLGDYIPGDNPDQKARAVYKLGTTVYLFIGLLMMMLLLAVLYDIPELNLGFHFYLKSDEEEEERARLRSGGESSGPKYTKQRDEDTHKQSGGSQMYQPTQDDVAAATGK